MKWSEKSTEEKTSSSTKERASAPAKENPSTQAQASEHDNMSILADAANIAQVKDDTPLADFIKRSHKKSKISDVDKEPEPPQGMEPHPAPIQEEAPA